MTGGRLDRRRFVGGSAAALAAFPFVRRGRSGRSDELRVAVAGLNGRGAEHAAALRALPDVRVVALVDVDEAVLARELKPFRERRQKVDVYSDLRHVLERDDVDAVSLATPNHWHALQAIWCCQAGKDVFVETPVSHAVVEGARLVEAARRYGRIVHAGLRSRASAAIAAALAWTQAGSLGALRLARVVCYDPRPPIGKVERAQRIPDSVDYDLWCGPAPLRPLERARLHHDWRWDPETGNGELGDRCHEELDLARWALGEERLPPSVVSLGARLGPPDDGRTPNTQLVFFGYDPGLLVEVRGLPRDAAAQAGDWAAGMDEFEGVRVGTLLVCEGGTLRVADGVAVALDAEGAELRRWEGAADPLGSFVAAVRSRELGELGADVKQGHVSSALGHLASASHRLGSATADAAIREAFAQSALLTDAYDRLALHLAANAIDLGQTPLVLGPCLEFDPATESFVGDENAARFLTREYREPFVLPEQV